MAKQQKQSQPSLYQVLVSIEPLYDSEGSIYLDHIIDLCVTMLEFNPIQIEQIISLALAKQEPDICVAQGLLDNMQYVAEGFIEEECPAKVVKV